MTAQIRIGVGGWTFEPWRGVFYPEGLKQKDELSYMSRRLTAIEVNGTYYGLQKPETFAKWAAEVPDGFVFTLKGSRFATNRRVLAEAGESVGRFVNQGIAELGDKLGPLLWQFAPTKKFDAADFEGFLALLPRTLNGRDLRHCVEVRNPTFLDPAFIALLRKHEVAPVFADHATYPAIGDVTTDFVYARLQTGSDDIETAYSEKDLDTWAGRLTEWAKGGSPAHMEVDPANRPKAEPRDVFAFIIHEGKVRAPAGAQALIKRIDPALSPSVEAD
jgi:uncharacterized protein YecE (DUF72 family)